MRVAFPLLALTLATGAAAGPPQPEAAPGVVMPGPDTRLTPDEGRVPCRDTIQAVREERGLPQLQRETASPDEPLLIKAVDYRINGCSVMLMHQDTSDVRPLPALPDGPPRLERIPSR